MPLHGPSHRRPNQHSRDSIGTSLTAPEDDDKDDVAGDGDDDDDVVDDKEEERRCEGTVSKQWVCWTNDDVSLCMHFNQGTFAN